MNFLGGWGVGGGGWGEKGGKAIKVYYGRFANGIF